MHIQDKRAIPCKRSPNDWLISAIRDSQNHSLQLWMGSERRLSPPTTPYPIPTRISFRKVIMGTQTSSCTFPGQGTHHFTTLSSIPLPMHSNFYFWYKDEKLGWSSHIHMALPLLSGGSHSQVHSSLFNSSIAFSRCTWQMISMHTPTRSFVYLKAYVDHFLSWNEMQTLTRVFQPCVVQESLSWLLEPPSTQRPKTKSWEPSPIFLPLLVIDWMFVSPLDFICWYSNPQCDGMGGGDFGMWLFMRVESSWTILVPLEKRLQRVLSPTFSPCEET